MMSRLPSLRARLAVNLTSPLAGDLTVCWQQTTGGTEDPGTGGISDGTTTYLSGTLRAFGHESEPKNALRRYAEIAAGDLILDLAPEPQVRLFPGQILSGTLALDALADQGLRYHWGGRWWTSKEVGPDLQQAWDVVGGTRTHRTLVLRRAT